MRLLTTTAVFASSLGLISAAYPSYPEVQDLYARDLYDTPDIYARDAYDDYGASELYARDDFDDNELLARDADYDDGSFPESDGLFTRASEGGMSGGSCMDCRMAFEREQVRIKTAAAKIAAKRRMHRMKVKMMHGSEGAAGMGGASSKSGAAGTSGALGRRSPEVIAGTMGETMGSGHLKAMSKITATKHKRLNIKKRMAKNKKQLKRCLKKCGAGGAAGGAATSGMGAEGKEKSGGSSKGESSKSGSSKGESSKSGSSKGEASNAE